MVETRPSLWRKGPTYNILYILYIHTLLTYFPIVSWVAGRDLKGSWQGPKGELAGT